MPLRGPRSSGSTRNDLTAPDGTGMSMQEFSQRFCRPPSATATTTPHHQRSRHAADGAAVQSLEPSSLQRTDRAQSAGYRRLHYWATPKSTQFAGSSAEEVSHARTTPTPPAAQYRSDQLLEQQRQLLSRSPHSLTVASSAPATVDGLTLHDVRERVYHRPQSSDGRLVPRPPKAVPFYEEGSIARSRIGLEAKQKERVGTEGRPMMKTPGVGNASERILSGQTAKRLTGQLQEAKTDEGKSRVTVVELLPTTAVEISAEEELQRQTLLRAHETFLYFLCSRLHNAVAAEVAFMEDCARVKHVLAAFVQGKELENRLKLLTAQDSVALTSLLTLESLHRTHILRQQGSSLLGLNRFRASLVQARRKEREAADAAVRWRSAVAIQRCARMYVAKRSVSSRRSLAEDARTQQAECEQEDWEKAFTVRGAFAPTLQILVRRRLAREAVFRKERERRQRQAAVVLINLSRRIQALRDVESRRQAKLEEDKIAALQRWWKAQRERQVDKAVHLFQRVSRAFAIRTREMQLAKKEYHARLLSALLIQRWGRQALIRKLQLHKIACVVACQKAGRGYLVRYRFGLWRALTHLTTPRVSPSRERPRPRDEEEESSAGDGEEKNTPVPVGDTASHSVRPQSAHRETQTDESKEGAEGLSEGHTAGDEPSSSAGTKANPPSSRSAPVKIARIPSPEPPPADNEEANADTVDADRVPSRMSTAVDESRAELEGMANPEEAGRKSSEATYQDFLSAIFRLRERVLLDLEERESTVRLVCEAECLFLQSAVHREVLRQEEEGELPSSSRADREGTASIPCFGLSLLSCLGIEASSKREEEVPFLLLLAELATEDIPVVGAASGWRLGYGAAAAAIEAQKKDAEEERRTETDEVVENETSAGGESEGCAQQQEEREGGETTSLQPESAQEPEGGAQEPEGGAQEPEGGAQTANSSTLSTGSGEGEGEGDGDEGRKSPAPAAASTGSADADEENQSNPEEPKGEEEQTNEEEEQSTPPAANRLPDYQEEEGKEDEETADGGPQGHEHDDGSEGNQEVSETTAHHREEETAAQEEDGHQAVEHDASSSPAPTADPSEPEPESSADHVVNEQRDDQRQEDEPKEAETKVPAVDEEAEAVPPTPHTDVFVENEPDAEQPVEPVVGPLEEGEESNPTPAQQVQESTVSIAAAEDAEAETVEVEAAPQRESTVSSDLDGPPHREETAHPS